jgi:Ser/Thr protein kinase RdoA (MazF antagonist)
MAGEGFCHGDFHTGNMIETGDGVINLLDFDAAAMGFSVIDPAVICDRTDFNILKKEAFDATSRAIERFNKSYSKDKTPDEGEYRPFFPS